MSRGGVIYLHPPLDTAPGPVGIARPRSHGLYEMSESVGHGSPPSGTAATVTDFKKEDDLKYN